MTDRLSQRDLSIFEQIRQTDEYGNEFWGARQLAKVLEYTDFRNFQSVKNKAKEACLNSGQLVEDHIVDFNEEIIHGKGAKQVYPSVKLSRYACYLIVQNADPSKEVVALGQTYFAVQTRLQEIRQMDEYNSLSSEDEKRLFLRDEMAKHNIQLASGHDNKIGWIVLDQIRTIDKQRIIKKLGILSKPEIKEVKAILKETYID